MNSVVRLEPNLIVVLVLLFKSLRLFFGAQVGLNLLGNQG